MIVFELEVFLVERNGVAEEEVRSIFENFWDCIPGEIPVEGAHDIGEQEGNLAGQWFGKYGGESGECVGGANIHTWDGAISENQNRSDGVGVPLDLSGNTLLVQLVLLDTVSISQTRGVDNTDLEKRLGILITFKNTRTYRHAIVAPKFVKAGRVGLALVVRTTSFVGIVENIEVIMINVVARKDIGDEFHGRGFSDTSFPNKEDGVRLIRLII